MLLPWNTDAPIYHFPWATIGLIAVNTLVFFATLEAPDAEQWCLAYGDGLQPIQWITSNFMHSGFMHLVGNMIFLWGFGLVIEGKLGWWRFLLVYLGIGAIECAAEQMAMQDRIGYAMGASSIIYGLLAMSVVWAPRNEMSCIGIFGFRVFHIELSILTFGTIYILLEVVSAWLDDFNVSSATLHLAGAAPGFAIGLALLKLKLVDCEGWDLLTVLAGREGAKFSWDRTQAKPGKKKTQAAIQQQQAEDENLRSSALAKIDEHLAAGNVAGAWALHKKMADRFSDWRLGEPQLLNLIKALHSAGRWHDSIEPMVLYLKQYSEKSARVRLKLAQILLAHENRPSRALGVLAKIPSGALDADLNKLRAQLVKKAEAMLEEGEIELAGDDW